MARSRRATRPTPTVIRPGSRRRRPAPTTVTVTGGGGRARVPGAAPRAVGSDLETLEQVGHERGDGAALAAGERDVGEQRVPLERLDHRGDAVVAADPQVVALGDVVGEDDTGVLA